MKSDLDIKRKTLHEQKNLIESELRQLERGLLSLTEIADELFAKLGYYETVSWKSILIGSISLALFVSISLILLFKIATSPWIVIPTSIIMVILLLAITPLLEVIFNRGRLVYRDTSTPQLLKRYNDAFWEEELQRGKIQGKKHELEEVDKQLERLEKKVLS